MRHGTKLRFLLALVVSSVGFAFISILLAVPFGIRLADKWREQSILYFARIVESSSSPRIAFAALRSTYQDFIGPGKRSQIWAVDAQGKVLAGTSPGTLPYPWDRLPHPVMRDQFQRADVNRFSMAAVDVIRLAGGSASYLVVTLDRVGPIYLGVIGGALASALWTVIGCAGISLLLVFTYFRSRADEAVGVLGQLLHGNLRARFQVSQVDEVGKLMLLFNRMADEIEHLVGRLHEAQNSRMKLLQEISHDTRSPLTAARTALETLEAGYAGLNEADRRRCITIAKNEVGYLQQLVEDLFLLAEMDEPGYRGDIEEVDLAMVLESEIERRRSATGSGPNNLEWELELSASSGATLPGIRRLLTRLVRNALDNAAKYARSRVRVQLSRPDAHSIRLIIEDDGPGLTPNEIAAFGQRRSARLQSGALTSGQPLGLGSVIMKEIAQLHRGSVHLGNRQEGGAQLDFLFRKAA